MEEKKPWWQDIYPVVAIFLFFVLNLILAYGDFGELRSVKEICVNAKLRHVENADWLSPERTLILKVVSYVVPDAIAIIAFMSLYHFIKRVRKEDDRTVVVPVILLFVITPALAISMFSFHAYVRSLRDSVEIVPVHAPIIYVYNDDDTPVTVTLDIDGYYTYLEPEFNIDNGWVVTASPEGILTDAAGNEYEYLFWEADLLMDYELGYGFCIPGGETEEFLYEAMSRLGLSEHEAEAFVAYWLPYMEGNEYNVINFQTTSYEDSARLDVSPVPDVVVRVNMLWYASDEYVDVEEQNIDHLNPTVDERHGLTVVEWGGEMIEVS